MAVASGGYAEYCTSASTGTKLLHSNLTFEEGAGVGIPYYTAYRALVIMSVLIFSCLKNRCKNLSLFVGRVIFKDMTFCFLQWWGKTRRNSSNSRSQWRGLYFLYSTINLAQTITSIVLIAFLTHIRTFGLLPII